MPVTKVKQSQGSFSIQLAENTNRDIVNSYDIATHGFCHICVLPVWMDSTSMAPADILALSMFTGVYRKTSGKTRLLTLEGAHASIWAGDDQGKGELAEGGRMVNSGTSKSFYDWMIAVKPQAVATGTITPTGGNMVWGWVWTDPNASPKAAFDYICTQYQAEWEVTDSLKLNAGPPADLWGAPTVIATTDFQGRDRQLVALRATINYETDIEDYTRTVLGETAGGLKASTTGSDVYYDGQGNALVWKRAVQDSSVTDSSAAQAFVDNLETTYSWPHQDLTISTDSPNVMADVRCGAPIYVWAPELDVLDYWDGITYRGELIWPLKASVQQITAPVEQGQGVYFVNVHAGTIVDLTRYVVWENPGTQLQCGDPGRHLSALMLAHGSVPRT